MQKDKQGSIQPTAKQQTGSQGEEIAQKHLCQQGYRVIETNFFCKYGEIDLIAQKDDELFFVEIRRRIGQEYGSALESASIKKQQKMRRCAQFYLNSSPEWHETPAHLSFLAIDDLPSGEQFIEFIKDVNDA